ncbi:MAG: SAM-dependent methyltransferase [Sphingobacteriales bacterium]|nr:MAG: SAM-dependent methyltransferase [Sphingobacteriales bacterium]TAF80649.1 MAG: SAM-dependent methyltransferase [Sphingobacteriales bacterium]
MEKGTLYLIPVILADGTEGKSLSSFLHQTINSINEYIVENEKTARKCLRNAGLITPQSNLIIHDYSKHNRNPNLTAYLKGIEAGNNVGFMSEAGCPGIADPGADIVAEAHRRNIKVVPLVGPSSIFLALMASGFNGQSFAFYGYLPIDKADRDKKIKELELQSEKIGQTQIFIETPFRNNMFLDSLLKLCKPDTRLCIATNLTADTEMVKSKSITDWRKNIPDLHKKPTVFLLYRNKIR